MDEFTFEFEGTVYAVPMGAYTYADDVVRLPDGRFVELTCLESYPPQVYSVTVVDGPNPSGFGPGHEGTTWEARIVQ